MAREQMNSSAENVDGAQSKLITGGPVFDGKDATTDSNTSILVQGERITAVGPEAELDYAPEDTEIIDVDGATIMPGIVDAHTHLTIFNSRVRGRYRLSDPKNSLPYNTIRAMENVRSYLEKGVTAQREVGGREYISASIRDAIEEGRIPGPRVQPSGPILTPTAGLDDKRPYFVEGNLANGWEVNGETEIIQAVREQYKAGVATIKLDASGAWTAFSSSTTPTMTEPEIAAAVEEAHKFGIRVAAHAQATEGIKNAVRAGVDTIEHATYVDDEALDLLVENDVYVIPTLIPFVEFLKADDAVEMNESQQAQLEADREAQLDSFRRAQDRGVKLAVGSDAIPPLVPHGDTYREIALFVEYGFSPGDALVAATKNSAEALAIDSDVGTLESGKFADLIAIEGDPLEDISVMGETMNPQIVMKGGTIEKDRRSE